VQRPQRLPPTRSHALFALARSRQTGLFELPPEPSQLTTHMNALACESCHIPKMYTAALAAVDWTVLNLEGTAPTTHRGVEGECGNPRDLALEGLGRAVMNRL